MYFAHFGAIWKGKRADNYLIFLNLFICFLLLQTQEMVPRKGLEPPQCCHH